MPTASEMGLTEEDLGIQSPPTQEKVQPFTTEETNVEIDETNPLASAINNVEAAIAQGNMGGIQEEDLSKVLEAATNYQNTFPVVEPFKEPERIEIVIDQAKRKEEVSAIEETDFFKNLKQQAQEARKTRETQQVTSIAAG